MRREKLQTPLRYHRTASLKVGTEKSKTETADSRSSPYPSSIPRNRLLRKDIPIPPAICLKPVADILLLLHVQVVELVHLDWITRTRSARRESAGWTLWRTLARTMRWVHMSCIGTKRNVWLASPPDYVGSNRDGASSRVADVQESLKEQLGKQGTPFPVYKRIGK